MCNHLENLRGRGGGGGWGEGRHESSLGYFVTINSLVVRGLNIVFKVLENKESKVDLLSPNVNPIPPGGGGGGGGGGGLLMPAPTLNRSQFQTI